MQGRMGFFPYELPFGGYSLSLILAFVSYKARRYFSASVDLSFRSGSGTTEVFV
jgi:hypothetical protein